MRDSVSAADGCRAQKFAAGHRAAATVLVLGGALLVYEETRQQAMQNPVSDAQLAQQVSSMAQDSEPQPTAPLQALFEE